jgi:hypothetical protein
LRKPVIAHAGSKDGAATSTYNRRGRVYLATHTLGCYRYSIDQKGLICNRKVIMSGFFCFSAHHPDLRASPQPVEPALIDRGRNLNSEQFMR